MLTIKELKEITSTVIEDLVSQNFCDEVKSSDDSLILLGEGSFLDSIGFVTFLMGCEEKIEKKINKHFPIRMNEIHDLNQGTSLILSDFLNTLFILIKDEK
tara:strand:- start:309 stop:611 length:303 start_codon:yes stop_codon:yes gene_type:complete